MTQPRQYVPLAVVHNLVDAFLASRKGLEHSYCSSFDPDQMRTTLQSVPARAHWDGTQQMEFAAYHEAVQVVLWFQCSKMTAHCNSWTPWMLDHLRKAKVPIAAEFLP